jgi:AcrR family transcriptional regulator
MMRKGERTREVILERAVILFNQKGYANASMSDIMEVTGLQKGGIYNHFASKEALAVEAFEYGVHITGNTILRYLQGRTQPIDRLRGFIEFFLEYGLHPPVMGGCILLNTAMEADDTNPVLFERTRQAMDTWRDLLRRTIRRGIAQGQMRDTVNIEALISLIISTLEGSIMMSKLYNDVTHIEYAVEHLLHHIDTSVSI